MKLAFSEIWTFLQLTKEEASTWTYKLVAGDCVWEESSLNLIQQVENDPYYDPEMLPNLFTFREIFWQPNVYPTLNGCLTGLKLVTNYSTELAEEYAASAQETHKLYVYLVQHIGKLADLAHEQLAASDTANDQIPGVLGEFRKQSFPVIMLFIHHPMNRADYREDALRRINFMVKTLLEQYQLRFNDLLLPHWLLDRVPQAPAKEKKKAADQAPETPPITDTESPT